MTPQEPEGREAREEDKASRLKNLGDGKGCAPRKVLPRIDLSNINSDMTEFVTRIPIGGASPKGSRSEEWQRIGINYLTGQLLPGRRKSMEPITKRIPDEDYQQLQQFITDSPWKEKATGDLLIKFLKDEIARSNGVIILDDTGSKKQGDLSPGVGPQYFSETGYIGNCQVTVTCVYADFFGPTNADVVCWPLGMKLYLPKGWDDDKIRRRQAGIPASVRYSTKETLALDLVENVRAIGVPHKAILADTWYGRRFDLRSQLREWREPYIVGVMLDNFIVVPADAPVLLPGSEGEHRGRKRIHPQLPDDIKRKTPRRLANMAKDWIIVRYAKGTKEDLEAKFTRRKVRVCKRKKLPTDEVGWLLLEDGPDGKKAYICWGLDDQSLEELVKLTHMRWAIEDYHKQIKDRLGFDHFQGRKYRGWQHHAILTQMTYAFLSWLRWKQRDVDGEKLLPTLPEVRRMLIKAIVEKYLMEVSDTGLQARSRCTECPVKRLVLESG